MLSEFRKSINTVINERVTSPFWGAVVLAWFFWNWKIIVLLLFVSESSLPTKDNTGIKFNKVEYILSNYSDKLHLLWGPLLSVFLIIAVLPFLSNASYWLYLRFRKWKVEKRNEIEEKQVLTIEQSLELRKEIKEQEKSFHDIIEAKDRLIESHENMANRLNANLSEVNKTHGQLSELNKNYEGQLKIAEGKILELKDKNSSLQKEVKELENDKRFVGQRTKEIEKELKEISSLNIKLTEEKERKNNEIHKLNQTILSYTEFDKKIKESEDLNYVLSLVKENDDLAKSLNMIMTYIQKYRGDFSNTSTPTSHIAFFEGNKIIEQSSGKYAFTSKGKEFMKLYSMSNLKT